TPIRLALMATFSAARVAAKGVLLRAPLNPTVPAESQHSVSPLVSVRVIIVLLKVALTCAMALTTFFRTFFLPIVQSCLSLLAVPSVAAATRNLTNVVLLATPQ